MADARNCIVGTIIKSDFWNNVCGIPLKVTFCKMRDKKLANIFFSF